MLLMGSVISDPQTDQLLREWRWLIPSGEVCAVTALGDMILNVDGSFWFLCAAVAQLEPLAASEQELARVLAQKKDEIFGTAFIEKMRREGLELAEGQCVGFKQPVVLGGGYTRSNAYAVEACECVSWLGDLHRQINDLPDGAKIKLNITD